MRYFVLLLSAGCVIDQEVAPKDEGHDGFDSADSGIPIDTDTDPPPPEEECNGADDDGDGQVDEDFPDDDGNGRADCQDVECPAADLVSAGAVTIDETCQGETATTEVVDPWSVRVQWQVTAASNGSRDSAAAPVIGNLDDDDGNGVINEDDSPEVVVNASGTILALDGATGAEKWIWTGAGYYHSVLIADVDADGAPDVVTVDTGGHVVALDGAGTEKWRSKSAVSNQEYSVVTAADLDEDGVPEVIADDLVVSGADGATVFSLGIAVTTMPGRMAAIADVDADGDQEIFIGGEAYDSDGTLLWSSGEMGTYGFWPVVVEADGDAGAEVGFVGQYWTLFDDDGTELNAANYGAPPQPGPPCAGDFDGDGTTEVVWPSNLTLVMYELDGTPGWSVSMDDTSGVAGCSGYDVDGDGALEVLFADQSTFRILDGATGATRYTDTTHRSVTIFEYPTVADIDHDGHAEIVVVDNSGPKLVTAYEHDGAGWPAAGSTWGAHDFAITNVEPDGTVPQDPDPYWSKYGVYRARVAADEPATADLRVGITDVCVADCDYGPVQVALSVENQGGSDVDAGASVAVYAIGDGEPREVAVVTLPEVPAGQRLDGILVELTAADVAPGGFQAVIDTAGIVEECHEDNNTDEWADSFCP